MSKMLASGVRPPSDEDAIDRLWFCSGSGGSVSTTKRAPAHVAAYAGAPQHVRKRQLYIACRLSVPNAALMRSAAHGFTSGGSRRTGSDAMRVLSSRTGSREGMRWVRLWAELCGLPCSGWRSSAAQGLRPECLRSAIFARVRDSFNANCFIGCLCCKKAGCTL